MLLSVMLSARRSAWHGRGEAVGVCGCGWGETGAQVCGGSGDAWKSSRVLRVPAQETRLCPACAALALPAPPAAPAHLKGEQLAHDVAGGAAHAVHKGGKVVEVRLVQRVAHDLHGRGYD